MQANFPDGTSDDLHCLLSEKQNKFITDIALSWLSLVFIRKEQFNRLSAFPHGGFYAAFAQNLNIAIS